MTRVTTMARQLNKIKTQRWFTLTNEETIVAPTKTLVSPKVPCLFKGENSAGKWLHWLPDSFSEMVTVGVEWLIGFISYCCWAQVLCLLPGFSTCQSKKITLWSNCQAWWSAITPEGALCAGRELDSTAAGWLMDTPVGCHSINLLVIGAVLCIDPGISLSHFCVHLVIWNNSLFSLKVHRTASFS